MTNPNQDAVERRLRAANPVSSERTLLPSGRTLDELLEATMSTELTEREQPPTKPNRWRILAVAAAVIAALTAGGIYLVAANDDSSTSKSVAHKTVLRLALPKPADPGMQMCMAMTAETLQMMQVAFSGTVTGTTTDSATLTVDHWYKGGDADEVRLSTPDPSVAVELEGGVVLAEGQRYLVTASDGLVNGCGFTLEWTDEAAAIFAEAFGG